MLLGQPSRGRRARWSGQSGDIEIHAREIARRLRRVEEILADHTGRPIEGIHEDTERNLILGPEEAIEYGLVDQVAGRRALAGLPNPVPLRPQEPTTTRV